jgi:hypothetical protein
VRHTASSDMNSIVGVSSRKRYNLFENRSLLFRDYRV